MTVLQVGSDSYTVRMAIPSDDLIKIANVINEAYKKAKFLMGDRIAPQEIKAHISNPRKRFYVCLSPKKEVCGTILLDFSEEGRVEFGLFAMHPSVQKTGIGSAFMKYVEHEAFKKVREIIMHVIPLLQGRLITFYERLGYTLTDQTLPFPESEKKSVLPEYRDQMYFRIMHKMRPLNS